MGVYHVTRNWVARKEKTPLLVDILNGTANENEYKPKVYRKGYSTTTKYVDNIGDIRVTDKAGAAINKLCSLPTYYLMRSYHQHQIPKKSGGIRIINEPYPELKNFQKTVAKIMYSIMDGAVSHTNAYAYIPHRSCKQAIERHKGNKSRWFLKLDIHDFFGSTEYGFFASMLRQVHPFEKMHSLPKQLMYCFIPTPEDRDVLPQGAPTSPILSNIAMIPIDSEITKKMNEMDLVYTRYCDDILISGRTKFDKTAAIKIVTDTFSKFGAPYELNAKKTRFGSYAGRNFNLGLMYNKDENITIGHRKKKLLKAQLTDAVTSDIDIQKLNRLAGQISYYKSIEPEYISYIIKKYSEKFDVNIEILLKEHRAVKMS